MVGDDPIVTGIELTDPHQNASNKMPEEDIEDNDLDKVPILLFPCRVYIVQFQHLYIFRSLEHLYQGNHQRYDPNSLSNLHYDSYEDDSDGGDINEEIEQSSRVQYNIRDII